MEGSRGLFYEKIPGKIPETQHIIMRLALILSVDEYDYIFYLDNLFISIPFAIVFKEVSIDVIDITRKNTKDTP